MKENAVSTTPVAITCESLLAEEAELQLKYFDETVAWQLGTWMVDTAKREASAPTLSITRGRHRLFHFAFAGTSADNDDWVARKSNTVYRFGHSSWYMAMSVARENTDGASRYQISAADYTFGGGGVPIFVRHAGLVGCVAVSGIPGNRDHTLAVDALLAVIKKQGEEE